MTRGGAAASEPFDLSEVSRSGDLLDDLAARRIPDPTADDPAVRLLGALVADVDAGAPPLPSQPSRVACTAGKPGRPVVRAFVTFGAATLMLTTTGAAVAGAGAEHGKKADGPAVQKLDVTERSTTGDIGIRAFPADRRTAQADDEAGPAEPPAAATRARRRGDGRRPAAAPITSVPASPRNEYAPISGGPDEPAPPPSPSPSAPSSPPVASDPPQSPPAGPPADPSAPPAPERADSAAVNGSARRSTREPAGAARDGAGGGARAGAAEGGFGEGGFGEGGNAG